MTSKILVVDDSRMVRLVVCRALEQAGFTVVEAVDGADALAVLSEHGDTRLVVCDLHMPRLDGLGLLTALQASSLNVPFVLLTTEGYAAELKHAVSLGAKGWLLKPVKPEQLVSTARALTRG